MAEGPHGQVQVPAHCPGVFPPIKAQSEHLFPWGPQEMMPNRSHPNPQGLQGSTHLLYSWDGGLATAGAVSKLRLAVSTSPMLTRCGYPLRCSGKGPPSTAHGFALPEPRKWRKQGICEEHLKKAKSGAENTLQRTSRCQINILIIRQDENRKSQRRARGWHICSLCSAVSSSDSRGASERDSLRLTRCNFSPSELS